MDVLILWLAKSSLTIYCSEIYIYTINDFIPFLLIDKIYKSGFSALEKQLFSQKNSKKFCSCYYSLCISQMTARAWYNHINWYCYIVFYYVQIIARNVRSSIKYKKKIKPKWFYFVYGSHSTTCTKTLWD